METANLTEIIPMRMCTCETSCRGDGIHIQDPDLVRINTTIRSTDVFQYLKDADDAKSALLQVLETGVTVLNHMASRRDMDFLREKTESLLNSTKTAITEFIARNLDPTNSGSLSEKIFKVFELQNNGLKEMLCDGKSTVSSLTQKVEGFKQEIQKTLAETLGKCFNGESGVALLLRQINSEVTALKEAILTKQTQSDASIHLKGENFEGDVLAIINSWAKHYQGTAGIGVDVRDVRTESGSIGRQGDFLILLHGKRTSSIVIESKDQEQISTAKILKVADESIVNRAADSAIYVAPDVDHLPKELGGWACFPRKYVTVAGALEVAIKMAVLQLTTETVESDPSSLDVGRLVEEIDRLQNVMKSFGSLLSAARGAIRNSEKVQDLATQIRDEASESIEKILCLIHSNDGGAE